MKKVQTLKKNYEFKNVLTKGKYVSGNVIEIFIKYNGSEKNRIGIAVSTKLAKAVKRNYIKRLLRENYRQMQEQLKQGYDMVFLWKKKVPVEQATFDHIQADFKKIFQKAQIWN